MSQSEIDHELADIEKQFGAQAAQTMRELATLFLTLTIDQRRKFLAQLKSR